MGSPRSRTRAALPDPSMPLRSMAGGSFKTRGSRTWQAKFGLRDGKIERPTSTALGVIALGWVLIWVSGLSLVPLLAVWLAAAALFMGLMLLPRLRRAKSVSPRHVSSGSILPVPLIEHRGISSGAPNEPPLCKTQESA